MAQVQRQAQVLQQVLQNFNLRKSLITDGYTFSVGDRPVGVIRPWQWDILSKHTRAFTFENRTVKFVAGKTPDEVTENMRNILRELSAINAFPALRAWRNEEYDVVEKFGDKPLFRIERSMTYIFGLKRYGMHINGYTIDPRGNRFYWLQRRARTKAEYPGKLDGTVGGGLGSGTTVDECMRKEALEEASISRDQIERWSRPVGFVSFLFEDEKGLCPETLFVYDALFPEDFEPKPNDGEVDEFVKVPFEDLLDIAIDPEAFNVTSLPVILDFLIRHHVVDHKFGDAYFKSVSAIHQNLEDDYPPVRS